MGEIGWLWRVAGNRQGPDVSAQFEELYRASAAGRSVLAPDANRFVYLTVRGLFGKHFDGFFSTNESFLRSRRLDVRRVDVDTNASLNQNVQRISEAVLKVAHEGRQAVLIGHSKGGVAIADALAKNPELAPHVRAAVILQAPYAGSAIASDISKSSWLHRAARRLFRDWFDGDPEVIAELGHERRRHVVTSHPFPKSIPAVTVTTIGAGLVSCMTHASLYTRLRHAADNDGMVARADGAIPHVPRVELSGVDHLGTIARRGLGVRSKYAIADFTQAIVGLALNLPPVESAGTAASLFGAKQLGV